MTLFFLCDKMLGERYWDIAKSVRHKTLTLAFRWFESSYPSQKALALQVLFQLYLLAEGSFLRSDVPQFIFRGFRDFSDQHSVSRGSTGI